MPSTEQRTWRAGRFWWDGGHATDADDSRLQALVFDLDALADVEFEVHRKVFNAAFAAHGMPFTWTVGRYRQLLALSDERQRVTAELRKRCVGTECDVLTELLADEICATKAMMFDEIIAEADLAPRPGLVDLVQDAYAAGVPVAVVSSGRRSVVEPLVRQLVGEGLVEVLVTADDVSTPAHCGEAHQHALAELGLPARSVLAIAGSPAGLRRANSVGLATVLIDGAGGCDIPAAAAVRADYSGSGTGALRIADCQRLLARWSGRRRLAA
jgi:beta-phosphoglucomutase-like phosphatase (HAD superfamily)